MNHLTTEEINGDVLSQSIGEPLTWPISEKLLGRKVRFDGYVTDVCDFWDYVIGEEYLIKREMGRIGPANPRGAVPAKHHNNFKFTLLPENEMNLTTEQLVNNHYTDTSVPEGYYHCDEEDKLKPLKSESTPLQYDPTDVAFKKATQTTEESDSVNHLLPYQPDGIECIDTIRILLGSEGFVAYCCGKAVESIHKKDCSEQDLRKAAWYLYRAADKIT